MKKILTTVCLVLLTLSSVKAQEYAVAKIPADLKVSASAVIRTDERRITIQSENNMSYGVKRVVTILNDGGDDFARILVPYDKSRKIKKLSLTIYNEYGIAVRKVKPSEFRDESFINDFSLFEDDRVKKFSLSSFQYPLTLELEFEWQLNQTLIIPDWFPQPAEDVSVEHAVLDLVKNVSFDLKYLVKGVDNEKKTQIDDKKELLQWKVENLNAKKAEPFSKFKEEILPSIKFSPVSFSYEGIAGSYTDWKSYGLWVYSNLLQGRSELPPSTVAFVKNLVKDAPNKKEAAKLIYEYAQKKNRYIS
ncbi:DUF3857 domain-containing protein, partial [Pseudoxanthomonas sp. SGD-10]